MATQGKHAKHAQAHVKSERTAAASASKGGLASWAESHGALAVLLLGVVACACALLLFYFLTFSDFSASADFIYNQF